VDLHLTIIVVISILKEGMLAFMVKRITRVKVLTEGISGATK